MQRYDHRLIEYVQETGDVERVVRCGVPKSTAHGWLTQPRIEVRDAGMFPSEGREELTARVARLEARVRRLRALLGLTFAVIRVAKPDLTRARISAHHKRRLLQAIDKARDVLGLRRVLRGLGISAFRLRAWRSRERGCDLADHHSCPGSTPQRVTSEEVSTIREFVTSTEFRHVPTGRLALLAQRMGEVFASATMWHRLVREHGWRRPRLRVHPGKPKDGIRATRPKELWHVDMTVIRLLDSSKVYLHAIIDNFSRRILAWRLNDHFDTGATADMIFEAGRGLEPGAATPKLMVDDGVENMNGKVDALIEQGILKRILAQVNVSFSNSLIEAWWRQLKHQWLFLNTRDSKTRVEELVAFYVDEHNAKIPHSALKGQTRDEAQFGKGDAIPDQLAEAREQARAARLEANGAKHCSRCA